MKTTVRHSKGSYEVVLTDLASVHAQLSERDHVVTDENVAAACGVMHEHLAVPAGERSKDLSTYGKVLEWLATRSDRQGRVVAFGGGVVGDLAGFAAATYMRGVELLMVPTSLLAMVDSSVGGKVGIDLPQGKNLAGAFWPPSAVLIPLDSLGTLPLSQFNNGMAEVWKYGAILDPELFESLESTPLRPDSKSIAEVVMRCIQHKRDVVEADEHETKGVRAILNFGHTVGHAIEHALAYEGMLHGEAVAIGMVAEARLAHLLGVGPKSNVSRLEAGLARQGLPTEVPLTLDRNALVDAMRRDKKAGRNGLAFALVSEIGTSKLYEGVAESDVLKALENL
jgi:3-dehydroquinate synthase